MGCLVVDLREQRRLFLLKSGTNVQYWTMFHLLSANVGSTANVVIMDNITLKEKILLTRMKYVVIGVGSARSGTDIVDIMLSERDCADVLSYLPSTLTLGFIRKLKPEVGGFSKSLNSLTGYSRRFAHRGYGIAMRGTMMDYCKREGRVYVGMGDEFESIIQAKQMGIRSIHIRWPQNWVDPRKEIKVNVIDMEDVPKMLNIMPNKQKYKNFGVVGDATDLIEEAIRSPEKFQKCTLVALFSLSNWSNQGPEIMFKHMDELAKANVQMVINYPRKYWCLHWHRNHTYDVKDNILNTYISKDNEFDDYALDESLIYNYQSLSFYDSEEMLSMGLYRGYRFKSLEGIGYSPNAPQVNQWITISNFKLIPDVVQQVMTNPTFFDRVSSLSLRYVYGLNETWMYKLRYEVIKHYYPDASLLHEEKHDTFVLGDRRISVSGHLINLLCYSWISPINMKAYLDSVENNLIMGYHEETDSYENNMNMILDGIVMEKIDVEDDSVDRFALWHTPLEYYFSIIVLLNLVKIMKINISLRTLVYVTRRVTLFVKKYDSTGYSYVVGDSADDAVKPEANVDFQSTADAQG
jgi:hypothetical protein